MEALPLIALGLVALWGHGGGEGEREREREYYGCTIEKRYFWIKARTKCSLSGLLLSKGEIVGNVQYDFILFTNEKYYFF